uniref:STAS domain-containing protein n=1 Tax=Ditylenchus dipsaci TaxID=166011 RepID=A0A915DMJ7_9BILA
MSMDVDESQTNSNKFCGLLCCSSLLPDNFTSSTHSNRHRRASSNLNNLNPHGLKGPRYELNGVDGDNEDEERLRRSKAFFLHYFPLIRCLQEYSFKDQFLGDLSAGIALGLHSAAEGFAMAFLAGLPPIYGIYTTFCAAFVYMFFGTSVHSFMGTNVIVCFMVRNVVERVPASPYDYIYMLSSTAISSTLTGNGSAEKMSLLMETNDGLIELASTLTFFIALFQALIYLLRLDFLFCYASEFVLKGFALGISVRIVFNQLQHVLHIKIKSCMSEMSLTCLPSMLDCLDKINLHTLTISIFSILLLLAGRQILGPAIQLRLGLKTPFSLEFLLILFTSFLSYLLDGENLNLETVKYVTDRVQFTIPKLTLFSTLAIDALAMAILIQALHVQLAKELGRRHKYRVDNRQELFAFVMIGSISSLMSSHPSGQSTFRNRVGAGAKSVVANVPLVLTLLPLIIWAPLFFQSLPVCILSCIVLTSLGVYFSSVGELPLLWHISKLDVTTFVFSCLVALLSTNTSFALFASVGFAAFTIIVRTQWPKFQLLVNVTGSGVYYAEKCFYGSELLDESGVAVLRFESSLLFNNVDNFRAGVLSVANGIKGQLLGVGIGTRTGSMKSMKSTNAAAIAGFTPSFGCGVGKDVPTRSTLLISGDLVPNYDNNSELQSLSKVVILDLCSVSIIDATGVEVLKDLFMELANKKIRLLLACANSTVRTKFKIGGGFDVIPKHYFFPSVHDAVLCAQQLGGLVAPSIHMSVSMNGCRDLITLSTATSNHDLGEGASYAGLPIGIPGSSTTLGVQPENGQGAQGRTARQAMIQLAEGQALGYPDGRSYVYTWLAGE